MDVVNRAVLRTIISWIQRGLIWLVRLGTPCARWSRARTTGVSRGPVDVSGIACARAANQIIDARVAAKAYFVVENPAGSSLWDWGPLKRRLKAADAVTCTFDMCRYGTSYRKPTKVSGTLPGLIEVERRCTCSLPHEHLSGLVTLPCGPNKTVTVWKTKLAGRYPPALCRRIVRVAEWSAPNGAQRPLGEANPWPGWAAALGKIATGFRPNL